MADLLPVSALTGPRDLFRCEPFHASITVAACHKRRGMTYGGGRTRGNTPPLVAFPECTRCELGAAVHAQVPPVAMAASTCSAPGCDRVVTGAKGRSPLCPHHRRTMRLVGAGALVREQLTARAVAEMGDRL